MGSCNEKEAFLPFLLSNSETQTAIEMNLVIEAATIYVEK